MKIKNKLLINNLITTLTAITAISIVISIILSSFIRNDYKTGLIKENDMMLELIKLKSSLSFNKDRTTVNDIIFRYKPKLNITNFVFIKNEDNKQELFEPFNKKRVYNDEEMQEVLENDIKKVYDIYLHDKQYMGYNNTIKIDYDGKTVEFLAVSLVPNHLIKDIINRIIIILIASIFLISMIIFFISSYTSRKITKPLEKLKNITEKISRKDYKEHIKIKTGDELESLANSINSMSDSIKAHDEKQREFYRNVSHDLKTPLTVISGYAEGIKTNILEDNNKALDTIIDECSFLKKQLENIIYLSKLESINDYYKFENTSINSIIEKALNKVESIIILNEIDIIYEPGNDYMLKIDGEKIKLMLINILSNCLKNTRDSIYIDTEIADEIFKITVTDNGKGFTKEFIEKPFDKVAGIKKEGSGIGMSIIKRILDAHSGEIKLENSKNGGAKYIVCIPVSKM
jgi:two-component system sensor histidine kinase CssS